MHAITPYLCFDGNCREALDFYSHALDGKVDGGIQTFGEGPMNVPDELKDKIMHATFRAGDLRFMACDSMPNNPHTLGNQVSLALRFDDEDSQSRVFDALAEGGDIKMPLQSTFWRARFGMLRDRYGIDWMLNYEKPDAEASKVKFE